MCQAHQTAPPGRLYVYGFFLPKTRQHAAIIGRALKTPVRIARYAAIMEPSLPKPVPSVRAQLPAPQIEISDGPYTLRFARSAAELDDVLRLRFHVFNMELGEGLSESFLTGRDRDAFDNVCHHLIVVDTRDGAIVGTYRMQIAENAAHGWYSQTEFRLADLPTHLLEQAVELGRACIDKDHRNMQVLYLLWTGIARYMQALDKRFLFGCCSLTSQDPREGKRIADILAAQSAMHPTVAVRPQPEYACYPDGFTLEAPFDAQIPKLFRAYLRFGAKVCGPPAIDRDFQTIDFFVLYDRADDSADARRFFSA
jgi:putative hemolysin